MKNLQIISILLAVAVVLLSAKLLLVEHKENSSNMNETSIEDAVLNNIMTRTSIREYTDEKISEEQITQLLKAGMAAPSAGNKQPWQLIVIDDKNTKDAITANISPAQPAAKAPLVIVVCADTTLTFPGDGHDYWIEDCSAVTQNILLAAHGMQLGAVWLGVYPQMNRCKFLSQLLSLPSTIIPLGMVAVGHPAENPAPKDKWDESKIHKNSWDNTTATVQAHAKEWKKVSVAEARLGAFNIFSSGAALTVGKQGNVNSMAIGWGQIGTLWGKERNVCTVYVRQSRFTKHLMDENSTFTVETFPAEYNKVLFGYLGRVSGRDEDKVKGSGLTLKMLDSNTPAFDEGNLIIECRKISAVDIPMANMDAAVVDSWYKNGEDAGNIHTQYIGEITAVWIKK
ncbi:MAG: nitroreductase family protein [Muribaculaceae bacterium]